MGRGLLLRRMISLRTRGISKRGPAGPLLVVSIGVGPGRGRNRNLPLPGVVFFAFFLLDTQKKEGSSPPGKKDNSASLVRMRSGAAGQYSIAYLFTSVRGEKISKCSPVFALGARNSSRRFESPSGTRRLRRRRCNLPSEEHVASKAQQLQIKEPVHSDWLFYLELLGRFELPTSSLPRMRSTY